MLPRWGQTEFYEMSQHPKMVKGHYYGVAHLLLNSHAEFREEVEGWALQTWAKPSGPATIALKARSQSSTAAAEDTL